MTVNFPEENFGKLDEPWLPNMSQFLRIRIDLMLSSVVAGAFREYLHDAARLVRERGKLLQFLEIRLATRRSKQSFNLCSHSFIQEIAEGMREIAILARGERPLRDFTAFRPMQVSWGVSEQQKKVGDYSCNCTYLGADSLNQVWSQIESVKKPDVERIFSLQEETCNDMGCRLHQS